MEILDLKYYDHKLNKTFIEQGVEIDMPRICAHCSNTGQQVFVDGILMKSQKDELAKGIIFTACQLCGATSMHFLDWRRLFGIASDNLLYFVVDESFPKKFKGSSDFPESIKNDFPDFVEIYSQSQAAEDADLNQLAGMGYRKALEFFITDFLIQYPVEGVAESWLTDPKTPLKQKVDKIPDVRIKNLATAISYLGNDETHYTRRHPDYDVNSIKAFIDVLVSEVEKEIAYKNAEDLINKPKGSN